MASIFNALHIGYSGLNAAQVGIDTTGHNIANAETEGYSRQRVVTSEAQPIGLSPGQRGNGTQITEVVRIFDKFVYDRYETATQNQQYSETLKSNLEELSSYFPDIANVGIKEDLSNYFNSWQLLASNPANTAIKTSLAQQTLTLTQHITQTRVQIEDLQHSLDNEIATNIEEVNKIASQIADLNGAISLAESDGLSNANDLRDKRGVLELSLKKLVAADVYTDKIQSNTPANSNIAVNKGAYTVNVGGFNLIDGSSFHPIGIDNTNNAGQFNDIYYERQDGVRFPIAEHIKNGKVGALIELRGSQIDENGKFKDGFLQETIDSLDVFAKGLIESTNNLYAQSATKSMESNPLSFERTQPLLDTDETFKAGTFSVVAYDIDGNVVARRSIVIDTYTVIDNANSTNVLSDGITPNSITQQMSVQKDDSGDNNALNDIDDILTTSYVTPDNIFSISLASDFANKGYTFAIEDNGTNFAGATGVKRFLDGSDAKNISLNASLKDDPAKINAYKSPISGDNQTALDMVQLQYTSLDFEEGYNSVAHETIYSYYDNLVTKVGTFTNASIAINDSATAQLNAVKQEYDSISKVSIDEELANLIRYQTSYGAAAKVITTIDQMMTTLLGLKA